MSSVQTLGGSRRLGMQGPAEVLLLPSGENSDFLGRGGFLAWERIREPHTPLSSAQLWCGAEVAPDQGIIPE